VFVVLEHKPHGVAFAIEALDSFVERGDQIVECPIEHIGQYRPFQVTPQPFNEIEARTVWREPVDPDLMTMFFQKRSDRVSVMKSTVVAHQADSPPLIGQQQCRQERDEVGTALG